MTQPITQQVNMYWKKNWIIQNTHTHTERERERERERAAMSEGCKTAPTAVISKRSFFIEELEHTTTFH